MWSGATPIRVHSRLFFCLSVFVHSWLYKNRPHLEAVRKLAEQSVVLIGVDVPSVDQLDSKDLPIHHALYRAGITILESVFLADVTPGSYLLAAFPLPISGGDAAPVRAVLIQQEPKKSTAD